MIQNYYERWQRHRHVEEGTAAVAPEVPGSEFEFFCPMHPFVVRDHPDKCPICGMDLAQRKRGEAVALPAGVFSRAQVSPDRILQAGVEVEPAAYRLLVRAIRSYGVIEPNETKVVRSSLDSRRIEAR
jgi:Cu(I)/Ag(I) efflux system membrane fusion protein